MRIYPRLHAVIEQRRGRYLVIETLDDRTTQHGPFGLDALEFFLSERRAAVLAMH